MKLKYLLAVTAVTLGAGCLALAKQQNTFSLFRRNTTMDVTTGAAAAYAHLEALRHSDRVAQQGQTAMDQKRYQEAEKLFRKAIVVQPHNPLAWLLLAEACERQGKLEEALDAYHTIVYAPNGTGGSIGSDPVTRMRYVLALVRGNRYAEAVAVYDLAHKQAARQSEESFFPLRFDANNPDENRLQAAAHYVMGVTPPLHREAASAELRQHLEAAMRFAPDWGKPHAALAKMLDMRYKLKEAEIEYAKARQLGEHVESSKQRMARMDAEIQRKWEMQHPGQRNTHSVGFAIKLTPEQIAGFMAKGRAEMSMTRAQWEVAHKANLKAETAPRGQFQIP